MTFYQILWTFFIYSFVGWCCEVAFAACKTGQFVNRGFLFGPLCPIYGFGVVAALLLIEPIREHWLQAYLVAVLVPTVIEYFVGWAAMKLLHTRLWDYSRMPLNVGGHVCLLFSLVWGVGCLAVVYLVQPLVLKLLAPLPVPVGWVLLALFGATALADLILTAIEAAKIPKRLQALEEMERGLRRISDGIGAGLSGRTLELWEKGQEKFSTQKWDELLGTLGSRKQEFLAQRDEMLEKYHAFLEKPSRGYARLLKAFPHLQQTEAHRRLSMGYPSPKDERDMILRRQEGNPLLQIRPVLSLGQLTELQDQAAGVYIQAELVDYVVRLAGATRSHPAILRGASPRATLSVTAMAKSIAFLNGRDYVIPSDIQTVFCETVAHRLLLEPSAEARGRTARDILEEILKAAAAPKVS